MNDRVMQFRVGLVVGVTMLIAVVLVILFTRPMALLENHFTVFIEAPQAPGVTKDTPVRKHGILVGRVADVQLADQGARITLLIQSRFQYKLKRNEVCRIGGGSLLGDSVLSFVPGETAPGKAAGSEEPIQDGDVIAGQVAVNPFQALNKMEGGFQNAAGSVASASGQISELAARLNNVINANDGRLTHVLNKSAAALEGIQSMAKNIELLVQDPGLRGNLNKSLAEMPVLIREAREATSRVKYTLAVADRSLKTVAQATEPLAEEGKGVLDSADELFRRLTKSADKVEELVENLLLFSQVMNRRDSTLGKLLNESELYDNLTQASRRVNRLTGDISRLTIELRPVIHNARVFSDKIARHPEKLGVAGALRGSSGAKPVRPIYPP